LLTVGSVCSGAVECPSTKVRFNTVRRDRPYLMRATATLSTTVSAIEATVVRIVTVMMGVVAAAYVPERVATRP
jgi:hypothetical protein